MNWITDEVETCSILIKQPAGIARLIKSGSSFCWTKCQNYQNPVQAMPRYFTKTTYLCLRVMIWYVQKVQLSKITAVENYLYQGCCQQIGQVLIVKPECLGSES